MTKRRASSGALGLEVKVGSLDFIWNSHQKTLRQGKECFSVLWMLLQKGDVQKEQIGIKMPARSTLVLQIERNREGLGWNYEDQPGCFP